MTRVVVVGNGMAGARFVTELLDRDADGAYSVTVIGEETGDAYNRALLSNVLAGTTDARSIVLTRADWYAERGVALLPGVCAERIDRQRQRVRLSDGTSVGYDRLVLATGSVPVLPDIPGLVNDTGTALAGVVPFRTLDDCLRLDTAAAAGGRAVVLGAGVLGLEVARGLRGRGLEVTVVQRGALLMERQLDADAARLLARTTARLGIDVRVTSGIAALHGRERLEAVTLTDGTRQPTDLLVLCCGVRPRMELAQAARLTTGTGVVVDDRLTTSDPAILAIGECAEHRGRTYGLVAPAWEQARIAAEMIARPAVAVAYTGSRPITRLKAEGIELAALGSATADPWDPAGHVSGEQPEIVCFADHARGVYQKLVIEDGRLVGAILLGDTRVAGTVSQLFERGSALPADRADLLRVPRRGDTTVGQSPTTLPDRTTICQCNGVTKGGIRAAWQDGARTVAEVATRTRSTTGCGTCRGAVEGIVAWLAAADTAGPADPAPPADGAGASATLRPEGVLA